MLWPFRALIAALLLAVVFGASRVSGAEGAVSEDPAPVHFVGHSVDAFAESVAAIESGMGEAQRFVLHMKLAQVRNKLAEQHGRPLTDAEFAAELDGKSLEEFGAMADSASTQITIDIETSDDT